MSLLRAWDMRWNGAIRSVDEWQLVFPEKNPERRGRDRPIALRGRAKDMARRSGMASGHTKKVYGA